MLSGGAQQSILSAELRVDVGGTAVGSGRVVRRAHRRAHGRLRRYVLSVW